MLSYHCKIQPVDSAVLISEGFGFEKISYCFMPLHSRVHVFPKTIYRYQCLLVDACSAVCYIPVGSCCLACEVTHYACVQGLEGWTPLK